MAKELKVDEAHRPKKQLHANAYPAEGFSLLVDGRFKSHYETRDAAHAAAVTLKGKFPLLQVAVRDAVTFERSLVESPEPERAAVES